MEQQIIEAVEDAVGRGVLAIVVLVILSGAAAFLASYLTVKGQNLAKKEDITDLEEAIQEVRTFFAKQMADYEHRNRLRLAALPKRLDAHQEAYTRWLDLKALLIGGNAQVAHDCLDWWESNCLYLSPKASEAFFAACHAAGTYHNLIYNRGELQPPPPPEVLQAHSRQVWSAGEVIRKEALLPGFTPDEEEEQENAKAGGES